MELSVVVPTYNERDSLPGLLERVSESLAGMGYGVVVVDDDSPDRTAEVARRLSNIHPVKVVVRKERGLSSAIVRGFRESASDAVCVIDADLQHPPERIPRLLQALEDRGADVAVASRYLPGSTITGWNWWRLLVSHTARGLARTMLPRVKPVKDPLSGFFIARREVLSPRVHPVGYKVLLELLVNGNCHRVVEIPYHFSGRASGSSKLGPKEFALYLKQLSKLAGKGRGRLEHETSD